MLDSSCFDETCDLLIKTHIWSIYIERIMNTNCLLRSLVTVFFNGRLLFLYFGQAFLFLVKGTVTIFFIFIQFPSLPN
jgi:hypothetical protein